MRISFLKKIGLKTENFQSDLIGLVDGVTIESAFEKLADALGSKMPVTFIMKNHIYAVKALNDSGILTLIDPFDPTCEVEFDLYENSGKNAPAYEIVFAKV